MFRTPLAGVCEQLYGTPFLHVRRANLHRILVDDLPSQSARLGVACTTVHQDARTAIASFADGSAYEADVIVGADGIHSVIRTACFGEQAPRFTGNMCRRAVVPFDQPPFDVVLPDSSFWMGPHGHVVTYYVQGGRAVNVVAVAETAEWVEESWTCPSTRDELLAGYVGWHEKLQRLFSQAGTVFK